MAPVKRKAVTDERPSKKVKSASSAPAHKSTKSRDQDSNERRAVPKSLLQQEDRAFPRGGASVLTPIEHKQIKSQAEKDVLFELQNGRSAGDEDGSAELFDESTSAPVRKKQKKRGESNEHVHRPESSGVKIQGLSYRNLLVGSVVLGYVNAITSRDVALALANNLTGYVPVTAVSEKLNARIESLLEDEGTDGKADEDEADVDLKQLFHVGQWLRASVSATASESTDSNGKSKRHIELSVDPRHVNEALDADNVTTNSTIQASVRSVEDHGIIMDVGLADSAVKGFVSKKELGNAFQLDDVQEGQVILCLVTGKGSNGKVLKLSPDAARFSVFGGGINAPSVGEAPTVDGFQSGTAVDILVTESGPGGIVGKVMGMLDVTADVVHSGAGNSVEAMSEKYKIGSKIKGRIIWTTPTDDRSRRIGISLLDHMLTLPPPPLKLPENANPKLKTQAIELEQHLPLSCFVEEAKVKHVLADRGLFMTLPPLADQPNRVTTVFAHISQISDTRIDTLASASGPYKLDSTHRARVISYNPIDKIYYISLKKSILNQAFLRVEDLTVGEFVRGTVERLILGAKGITGVLVKLSDSVTGLVPEMHLSDAQLQHPERKYKEGYPVKARVLSVDLDKRHVRLTTKKSLVSPNDLLPTWRDYATLEPGMENKGTIINLLPSGAVVQFYGNVRAFLPVAEMSETFIERPEQHFRLGQTVAVRIVSVDPAVQEMKVSCKSGGAFDPEQEAAWTAVTAGELVSGIVAEKSGDSIALELENGLRGLVRIGQVTDSAPVEADNALKKIHVGRTMTDLLVLDKLERSRHLLLTKKPSMVEDAKAGVLVKAFADVQEAKELHGFVRNVTPEGVFMEFANGVVGLVPKSQVAADIVSQPDFGLAKDQTITAWVVSVDFSRERFTLSMREQSNVPAKFAKSTSAYIAGVQNPVDPTVTTMTDFILNKVTRARVASVKATQINIRLADNVQGRIDVSEVFDSWDSITNKKAPLQKFKSNEILDVKILGIHDARHHRFLPISHRQSSVPVFELSAKQSRIGEGDESGLTMQSLKAGESHFAFVNNHGDNCVWVNLSPNVRGRIALMDLSDDVGQLQNLSRNFPNGCALRTVVKSVDAAANRLDLSARIGSVDGPLTIQNVSPGMIVAGRVVKITERTVIVQLSEQLSGPVTLVELGDNYDILNLDSYHKNDIVRVCILDVDQPNKKIFLSLRPSKVLSSSLPVTDPQVTTYSQLKTGDIVRGFVKHIGENGAFVSLGARVDALVRITDLSDQYIKDWKSIVQVDQLVKGRILSVDLHAEHVTLSLKASHVDENFKPPINLTDMKLGMIVTGKVRKVEDFGAFIDIDNTQPRLSGLCHRSEVAAKRVEDVRKIFSEGDVVKAKILNVDVHARKISLGLKASYFVDEVEVEGIQVGEESEGGNGVEVGGVGALTDEDEEDFEVDGGVNLDDVEDVQSEDDDASADGAMEFDAEVTKPAAGLRTSGFDWSGDILETTADGAVSDSEPGATTSKKRKRQKPEIKIDMTGDLDKYGPRSVDDFERQLLGQPNDSGLWVQYMAFQLQLSEIQKARDVAERALRTIHIREVEEKANIWIAWLNLEVEYGDEDRVDDIFKQACQVQDSLEMHEKLASICIDSGKHKKADTIFERVVANKTFRASPDIWFNYANFLMDTLKAPARARALLSRALQSVPTNEHRLLTAKFAALEFRSPQGDSERGRTIFEGLVSEWPKWSSGWDMFVDLERSVLAHAPSGEEEKIDATGRVRGLYQRMAAQKMKKRRAKFVFKRWLEFEEGSGKERDVERVKGLAREFVESQRARGDERMEE